MKIEYCEHKWITKELCKDIKYCCGLMQQCVEEHHIQLTERGSILYLDPDRNYGIYLHPNPKRVPIYDSLPIGFCPFCGEKIEIDAM